MRFIFGQGVFFFLLKMTFRVFSDNFLGTLGGIPEDFLRMFEEFLMTFKGLSKGMSVYLSAFDSVENTLPEVKKNHMSKRYIDNFGLCLQNFYYFCFDDFF